MKQQEFKIAKQGIWEFRQFNRTPNVIIAETKLKWYDEQRLDTIIKELRQKCCHTVINLVDEDQTNIRHKKRKTCRIEIYKKYDTNDLNEKLTDLQNIINTINFN